MDRFWDKCIPEPNSGCWLWTASLFANGYGKVNFSKKTQYAHRVAYQLTHGAHLDRREYVCHLCDNRSCVNPGHLVLADAAWNARDMHRKGRAVLNPVRGELHKHSKLTDAAVQWARASAAFGVPVSRIARQLGVSHVAAKKAIDGATWGHV